MCSLNQLYAQLCNTKMDVILPPLVFWTFKLSSVLPAIIILLAAISDDVQTIKAFYKHQKRKLTIVVCVAQVHRQSGALLGAVSGVFLTAALKALRVRLSCSRWVRGGVTARDGWPRPPAR